MERVVSRIDSVVLTPSCSAKASIERIFLDRIYMILHDEATRENKHLGYSEAAIVSVFNLFTLCRTCLVLASPGWGVLVFTMTGPNKPDGALLFTRLPTLA